jgi:hypothetical protein
MGRNMRSGRDTSRMAEPHGSAMDQGTPSSGSNSSDPTMVTPPVIDHATFQQQVIAMMNLLTQSVANNQQGIRESTIAPQPSSREPKVLHLP